MSLTSPRQAPAAAQASHSANVVSCFAMANARAMVTFRTGPSSTSPPPERSPIRKEPGGATTISGHSSQSRKTVPGSDPKPARSGASARRVSVTQAATVAATGRRPSMRCAVAASPDRLVSAICGILILPLPLPLTLASLPASYCTGPPRINRADLHVFRGSALRW